MKWIGEVVLLAVAMVMIVPMSASAQFVRGAQCPVTPDESVKKRFHVDFEGETLHFCCRNCVKAFKRKPWKYMGNLNRERNVETL